MSFDVYFQRFSRGEVDHGGGDLMRQVLEPFIVSEVAENRFVLIESGDGSADVYLDGDAMMANHVSGSRTWDLLVQGARAAGWVIMPVGCPTCITAEAQRGHLPVGLDEQVEVVLNGADLIKVIQSA